MIKFLNRIKVLLLGTAGSAIALYDVITQGGIDLNGILRPLLGDRIDVGRALATVALIITLLRFVMQSKLFETANRNGIDNPEKA